MAPESRNGSEASSAYLRKREGMNPSDQIFLKKIKCSARAAKKIAREDGLSKSEKNELFREHFDECMNS